MRTKDTFDVVSSAIAVVVDAIAIYGGFILAYWIRFHTDLIPVTKGYPPADMYIYGSGFAALLFLFIFRALNLYVRPQLGSFSDQIPRLVRACTLGILLTIVLGAIVRTEHELSRWVLAMAAVSVPLLVMVERYVLSRIEYNLALQHSDVVNRVIVLGTNEVARHLQRALQKEPRLRSHVVGFLRTNGKEAHEDIDPGDVKGGVEELDALIEEGNIDQLIVADPSLSHAQMVDIILKCERSLITFSLVPDLFRVLTSNVQVQNVDGIPLVGVGQWPLDHFWHRCLKRAEDVAGALVGLILSAPIVAAGALLVKTSSPGPVFYKQERCGEKGKPFTLYKLRTMQVDAEDDSGPVWATEDDPRRTRVGTFLRRFNLDELPQFWNVLKGDMSLVGPRPERPHFVEQFRGDIGRYMWRHVSKPGMTGWAQVNGLRGNTSIQERIKYDLYYLEYWSLAFDFKILVKTLFSRQNAY